MIPAKRNENTQAVIDEKELDGQNNEGDLVDNTTPEPTEAPTDDTDAPPMS